MALDGIAAEVTKIKQRLEQRGEMYPMIVYLKKELERGMYPYLYWGIDSTPEQNETLMERALKGDDVDYYCMKVVFASPEIPQMIHISDGKRAFRLHRQINVHTKMFSRYETIEYLAEEVNETFKWRLVESLEDAQEQHL